MRKNAAGRDDYGRELDWSARLVYRPAGSHWERLRKEAGSIEGITNTFYT